MNNAGRTGTRMPRTELERRWSLARGYLKSRQLDALVILGSDDFLGGYVRWFLDRPAYHSYHLALIFYPDDLMTIVEHGSLGGAQSSDGLDPDFPGVGEALTTAAFRSAHYLHGAEGELVSAALKRRNCKKIGFVGMGSMPHKFVTTIADSPGVTITDATDDIDRFKVIKSAVEIEEIIKTAEMQDAVFNHVLANAKPGMRDVDITAMALAEGRRLGSEGGVSFSGSDAPNKPAILRSNHYQMRTIQKNDVMSFLIENNGSAGYYTELGRSIVFGKAPSSLLDAFDLACEAQVATLERLKPNTTFHDVAVAHDDFLGKHGLPPERRIYAHGQGYDLVERPLVRADEPGSVEAGMNLAVHPGFITDTSFGYICDNYMIGQNGPSACLHKTEKKIFEIG